MGWGWEKSRSDAIATVWGEVMEACIELTTVKEKRSEQAQDICWMGWPVSSVG